VVINGANLELFSPRPRNAALEAELGLGGRLVVGYLGTMGMSHGLQNAVAAAERLQSSPVTFLMVGTGAERAALVALAREKRLGNILFLPPQPKERMPDYWSLCDLALVHLKDSPTFSEVIPSKTFEAMAMGLPILFVGPEGEGSRIVLERGAGVWVPPGRPEALARAVLDLLAAPGDRAAMAARSRASAAEFGRERQAAGTLDVLRKAVAGRGPRG
jgi:glycosyltransferase involved in cell wall biosynthesis